MNTFKRLVIAMAIAALACLCPAAAFAAPTSSGLAAGQALQTELTAQEQGIQTQAKKSIFPQVKGVERYVADKRSADSQRRTATAGGVTVNSYSTNRGVFATALVSSTITATYKGETKTLATGVGPSFVTNGRYVFYAKGTTKAKVGTSSYMYDTYKSVIYRLDLKTGAKKKITSGKSWTIYGASKSYVYCGAQTTTALPNSLYAVNIKTGTKKFLSSRGTSSLEATSKRVAYTTLRGQVFCSTLYTCKASGAGNKVADTNVDYFRLSGSKVIYLKGKYQNGTQYFRAMSCSLSGSGKKALTGWREFNMDAYKQVCMKYKLGDYR